MRVCLKYIEIGTCLLYVPVCAVILCVWFCVSDNVRVWQPELVCPFEISLQAIGTYWNYLWWLWPGLGWGRHLAQGVSNASCLSFLGQTWAYITSF